MTDSGFIFEFTEHSEVATAWFIGCPDMDWLAVVYRDTPTSDWKAVYRFRWIKDDKDPYESKDTKSSYTMTPKHDGASPTARDHLVEAMDLAAKYVSVRPLSKVWRETINGSADDFINRYSKQPFAHARVLAQEPKRAQ